MFFDLLTLAFESFTAYCLYQLAVLPMLEKRRDKMERLSRFYDEQIKKLEKNSNEN